jgi:alkylation response protein AidB-like acyl-CoA dehydrogenase
MNLELTDEQVALRDTVRRFLTERAGIAAHVRPLLQDPTGVTTSVWRGLAALGTTGLLVPQEYDGAGMTMIEAGIVLEELGAALHPGPWLSTAVAAVRALTRSGAETQAATLLRGIADGSTIATVGPLSFGPPAQAGGAPNDAPRPEAVDLRDGAVLRGEMVGISDAAAADAVLVLADGPDGAGLFAVDKTSPAVLVTPLPSIDQTRKQFRVTLSDAPARRLAAVSSEAIQALVDDVLIATAADALGAARAVLDLAVDYAKVRHQFGRPIGSFQAVAHLCVDMYETVELARSGVVQALWAADAADAEERHLAAVRAKAFAGRLATVGDIAIQVFGGIGFTWEHDAHLYLKRLLSWSAFLGGPDRYLEEAGARLAGPVRANLGRER